MGLIANEMACRRSHCAEYFIGQLQWPDVAWCS